jgi:hypothetical protein
MERIHSNKNTPRDLHSGLHKPRKHLQKGSLPHNKNSALKRLHKPDNTRKKDITLGLRQEKVTGKKARLELMAEIRRQPERLKNPASQLVSTATRTTKVRF